MKEISKKIIIAGRKGSGKSALLHRLIFDEFQEEAPSPKGMQIERTVAEHSGKRVNLVLWDLDGDTSKNDTPDTYFLGANAILYVINLNDPESFDKLSDDLERLNIITGDSAIMVVANHSDRLDKKELKEVLMGLDQQPDIICSARTGEGIDELFQNALGMAMSNG